MPYIVNNSDGTLTVTVADSVVDTSSYSLALVGRNVSNYGQYFAQNTIRHLENFASPNPPSPGTRLQGQLWYDKDESLLRVWDGSVWKRATNIVVGTNRPTTDLTGGGTAFFDTQVDKLQIHNGTGWKDAAYAGEVTSRYSGESIVDNPTFYGTRIRSVFLKDSSGISYPVLALNYVKETAATGASVNRGSTIIDGQRETMMAIFSDFEFTIDTTESAIVDGITVANLATELVGTGGIAAERDGRLEGQILKGLNQRSEFETSGITRVNTLFADSIGTSLDDVGNVFVSDITVSGSLTVGSGVSVTLNGDLNVADDVTIGGTLAVTDQITCDAIVVANSSVFNGTTTLNDNTIINGNLTVNGVSTQSLGTDAEKIENIYGADIDTQNISVDVLATINDANITGGLTVQSSAATILEGSLTANSSIEFNDTFVANNPVTFNSTLNTTGILTQTGNIVMGAGSNIILDGGEVVGLQAVSQIDVADESSGNNNRRLLFVDGTGDQTAKSDSALIYNPDTGKITTTELDVNGDLTIGGAGTTLSITSGDISVTGGITATQTITGATLTDGTLSSTAGAITGGVSAQFSGTVTANLFSGTATAAQYADLAEIYSADADYEPGTVVKLGGSAEITMTTSHNDTEVFGVISTDPAYLMNKDAQGLPVAMTGRVPVKVIGKVKKGERLISSDVPGVAWGIADEVYDSRAVIGRSLQDKEDGDQGIVEAVIGVK